AASRRRVPELLRVEHGDRRTLLVVDPANELDLRGADEDLVAGVKLRAAVQPHLVQEGAVGAAEVLDEGTALSDDDARVTARHHGLANADVALLPPTDQRLADLERELTRSDP